MPAEFYLNLTERVVFSFGWGTLAFADVVSYRKRLLLNKDFSKSFTQIADISLVTKAEITGDQMLALATDNPFALESRRAIVAITSLQFGLSRMFHSYSHSETLAVVRNLAEAADWVRVPREIAHQAFREFVASPGLQPPPGQAEV